MNTLQKQRILEHTIYAIIALLIFATPIINALLMKYQTNDKSHIAPVTLDTLPLFNK